MHIVLYIASVIATVYSFIIVFRVLIGLFLDGRDGRAWRLLCAVTDPVLRLFHGIRFLRSAAVDFTPIAAVVCLQILSSLLWSFSLSLHVTLVTVLAALLFAVWRIFFWIIGFFAVCAIIRLAGLLRSRRPASAFFHILDNILTPPVVLVSRFFPHRRNIDYRTVLWIVTSLLTLVFFIGLLIVEPSLHLLCIRAGLRTW